MLALKTAFRANATTAKFKSDEKKSQMKMATEQGRTRERQR